MGCGACFSTTSPRCRRTVKRPSALASLCAFLLLGSAPLCAIMPALAHGCDARVLMGGLAITEYAREDVQDGARTVQNVGE